MTRKSALSALAIPLCALSMLGFATAANDELVSDKQIVDCLLQGQIRKLGNTVYQAPPRPVRIPAVDCEIRGGDFLMYDRASFSTSLSHWLQLAKSGDVNAQIYVGEIFERGLGRDAPDYAQAVAWYKRAAESGNPVAQINLAQLYEKGLGVDTNPTEAMRLYAAAFGPAGATDDGLDPGSLDDPGQKVQQLETQLASAHQEKNSLSHQLDAAQQRLSTAESSLQRQQQEQERIKSDLERAQNTLQQSAGNEQEQVAAQDDILVREQLLMDQQQFIANLLQEISRSETQVSAYQTQIERAETLEAALREQSEQYATTNEELRETRLALAEANQSMTARQETFDQQRAELQRAQAELNSEANASTELEAELESREATVAAQAEALEKIRNEIDQRGEQSRQLQNRLSDLNLANQKLMAAQSEARRYREEAELLKSMLGDTQQQLTQLESVAVDPQKITTLESELGRLRDEADEYQTRIAELEISQVTVAVADLAGPSIQLIEPSAFATRGVQKVKIAADIPHQQIIGKVSAPAGLLSLTVNQQSVNVNDRNVFMADIPLKGPETPITIVAIDNQAKRTERIVNLVHALQEQERKDSDVDFGRYHALLIGNEEYDMLPDLVTPKEDINAIGAILEEKYGFRTTYVRDGTRQAIMDSMYALLSELTKEDNLLIYYAGHGEYVTDTNRGVWLPTNANPESPANWISNVEINDYLKQIRAKQIIVVADSCYSGSLTRSALINMRPGLTDEEYEAHLEKMSKTVARVVLTSGGLAPVLDSAGPGSEHSIFAAALLEILSENDAVLSGQDLGRTISAKVSLAAQNIGYEQEPQYAPLNHASHQGGDFFFVPGFH